MKKLHLITFAATITSIISSCSYNPSTPAPVTGMNFKKDFTAHYNIFVADTADKNGNNGDLIDPIGAKIGLLEIVVDTAISYKGKDHVARVVTYDSTLTPKNDTNYFYQDPNGDLYRYNYGFNILNQFSYLVQAIGGKVDVGWVLAAKIGSATGTTWLAKSDSALIVSFNTEVYLTSQGQMMADTTFIIGAETIKTHHARNTVNATALGGASAGGQSGTAIIDSYYSTDINAVIEDFYRHVTLFGHPLSQQAQGKFKIMTSHN